MRRQGVNQTTARSVHDKIEGPLRPYSLHSEINFIQDWRHQLRLVAVKFTFWSELGLLELLGAAVTRLNLQFFLANFLIAEQKTLTLELPLEAVKSPNQGVVFRLQPPRLFLQLSPGVPNFLKLFHNAVGIDIAYFELTQQRYRQHHGNANQTRDYSSVIHYFPFLD